MTTINNPNNQAQEQTALLIEKIDQLHTKIEQLQTHNQQLSQKIEQLSTSQTENLNELQSGLTQFLEKLAESLNQQPSSNLKPTLENLTEAIHQVSFEVKEQRTSGQTLSNLIQQVLTAQQVMSILTGNGEQGTGNRAGETGNGL